MKNCNQKVKYTCTGSTTFAMCTNFEGEVNPQSEYTTEDCLSLEETTQDQYNQLENIWNEINLSELGSQCLDYLTDENDKVIVKNVLLKHEEEICLLKDRVLELENRQLCDFPISSCGIDLDCLSLPCDQSIATVADLFNALITKICETP